MATSLDEAQRAERPATVNIEELLEGDEQEEWEYEYSTTETETYYLTIELSYPEFKDRQPRIPHHSRGGYYKNWLDHNPARSGRDYEPDNDDENENEPLPEPEADDDEPEIDPEINPVKEKGASAILGGGRITGDGDGHGGARRQLQNETEDIQILELHSHNPIIAYKGRVFEGSWAEIIGTEAIFANRERDESLPSLRHLNGGVDFLGASASRIVTKEKLLKPKIPKEDPLAAIREQWNIRIPVGKDRLGERSQQTRFLENLIALKKKKGEEDLVTVWAKDGEGKTFSDNRDPDYKPRRRRRVLDENGEEMIPKRERRRVSGRKGGRPRLNPLRLSRDTPRNSASARGVGSPAQGPESISTPTPNRWTELEEAEEDEEEDDDEEEESDEDGDVSMRE